MQNNELAGAKSNFKCNPELLTILESFEVADWISTTGEPFEECGCSWLLLAQLSNLHGLGYTKTLPCCDREVKEYIPDGLIMP
jgi:hypothetical protein